MSKGFIVQLENDKVRVALRRRSTGGPYYAKWRQYNAEADGAKQYDRSTDAFDEREARNAARGMVEANAQQAKRSGAGTLTLTQAVADYIESRWPAKERLAGEPIPEVKKTTDDVRTKLAFFTKLYGDENVCAMTLQQATRSVQTFLDSKKTTCGPTSIISYQRVVHRFFAWLGKRGFPDGRSYVEWGATANPCAKAALDLEEPDDSALPVALDEKEIAAFIAATRGTEVWPIIMLCLGAGLRASEARRMTWENIDLDRGTMRVFGKKRWREIQIWNWLRAELAALPGERKGQVAGYQRYGPFIAVRRIRKAAFGVVKDGKIIDMKPNITLQSLRRTACQKAAFSGRMSMEQYSHYFGHSMAVAKKHYLGWNLMGAKVDADILDYKVGAKVGAKLASRKSSKLASA